MRLFHLAFGIAVIVVFMLTGQYMDLYHAHLSEMPDGPRMLFRTRHIYILLAGLLNLALGAYCVDRRQTWRRGLQYLGSGLIALASLLAIVAFFYEPTLPALDTPLTHWGMYAIVAGTLAHVASGTREGRGRAGKFARTNGPDERS